MNELPLKEPTTIGLSDEAHQMLRRFADDTQAGIFSEMADAYRFAISLSLSRGIIPPEVNGARTIFNLGTLDQDKKIYVAIKSLLETGNVPVYRWAERLADWGVREMTRISDRGEFDIATLILDAQQA